MLDNQLGALSILPPCPAYSIVKPWDARQWSNYPSQRLVRTCRWRLFGHFDQTVGTIFGRGAANYSRKLRDENKKKS